MHQQTGLMVPSLNRTPIQTSPEDARKVKRYEREQKELTGHRWPRQPPSELQESGMTPRITHILQVAEKLTIRGHRGDQDLSPVIGDYRG